MNPAILPQNENVASSLFQIAAHFEEYAAAGVFKKPTPALSQTPPADLLLPSKRLPAGLKSAQAEKAVAAAPRLNGSNHAGRKSQSSASRECEMNDAGKRNGHAVRELKKVEFSLEAPVANSVKLAADFTDWEKHSVEMMHSPDGVWFTVVPLAPGSYSYRFIVDGQWRDDPRSTQRVPNPFGSDNAMVEVT